jgi:hypothetical protein
MAKMTKQSYSLGVTVSIQGRWTRVDMSEEIELEPGDDPERTHLDMRNRVVIRLNAEVNVLSGAPTAPAKVA